LATLSPAGTANTTTFLRGDNTWNTPAGSPLMFVAQFANPASTVTSFVGLNGGNAQPVFGAVGTLMALPVGQTCSFKGLYVAATITANAASDTITITMIQKRLPDSPYYYAHRQHPELHGH